MTKRRKLPTDIELGEDEWMDIGDFVDYKEDLDRGPRRRTNSLFERDERGIYPAVAGPMLKAQSPYGYKDHYIYKTKGKSNGCDYSDRLMQFDYDKFNRCCEEVWGNKGQMFHQGTRSPKDIERFLQLYYDDDEVKLIAIAEGCNVSSGYPTWCFLTFNPKWDKTE